MNNEYAQNWKRMTIAIHMTNWLIAEALYQLLAAKGFRAVVTGRDSAEDGLSPDILLIDRASIRAGFRCRDAKVLLVDTGAEQEEVIALLASHTIQGVLSSRLRVDVMKRAFTAVCHDQIWIDDDTRALLDKTRSQLKQANERDQEIIGYICDGMSNREIAQRLGLAEQTVRSRLTRIFHQLHVSGRIGLMLAARPIHRLSSYRQTDAKQNARARPVPIP